MIKFSYAILAVIITAVLSSFIHYENAWGIAFKLTQIQFIAGITGIIALFILREKNKPNTNP